MQKFTNLHAKIKSVRKRLGLQQKDFIVQVSEKMGLPKALTPGLASQWESNLIKSRTTPTEEQLAAIAELSKDPWRTMAWFLKDDLPADRGFEVHPDGTFELEPIYDEAEAEAMAAMYQRDQEEYDKQEPNEQLIAWRKDPQKLNALREFLKVETLTLQPVAQPDLAFGSTPIREMLPPKTYDVTVELKGASARSSVGNVEAGQAQSSREFIVRRPRAVGDLVAFKPVHGITSFEGDMLRGSGELTENQALVKRRDAFYGAMEYSLIEDHGIHDTHLGLNKKITSGAISKRVNFFLHGISVQIHLFESNMPLGFIPMRITEVIGELLLVDRMQNRSAKKMLLLCSSEKRLDLSKLEENFTDIVQSAALLGVKIKFAVGPEGAAQAIAELIKASKESD